MGSTRTLSATQQIVAAAVAYACIRLLNDADAQRRPSSELRLLPGSSLPSKRLNWNDMLSEAGADLHDHSAPCSGTPCWGVARHANMKIPVDKPVASACTVRPGNKPLEFRQPWVESSFCSAVAPNPSCPPHDVASRNGKKQM